MTANTLKAGWRARLHRWAKVAGWYLIVAGLGSGGFLLALLAFGADRNVDRVPLLVATAVVLVLFLWFAYVAGDPWEQPAKKRPVTDDEMFAGLDNAAPERVRQAAVRASIISPSQLAAADLLMWAQRLRDVVSYDVWNCPSALIRRVADNANDLSNAADAQHALLAEKNADLLTEDEEALSARLSEAKAVADDAYVNGARRAREMSEAEAKRKMWHPTRTQHYIVGLGVAATLFALLMAPHPDPAWDFVEFWLPSVPIVTGIAVAGAQGLGRSSGRGSVGP